MPQPGEEQMFTLVTSDMTSYDLPGLNVKIIDKQLSSHMLDINSQPVYGELEQILRCMLTMMSTGMK